MQDRARKKTKICYRTGNIDGSGQGDGLAIVPRFRFCKLLESALDTICEAIEPPGPESRCAAAPRFECPGRRMDCPFYVIVA
jgi:hypothetical protein